MIDKILNRKIRFLNEGINQRIIGDAKLISITDEHENGVDTSIENNPSKRIYKMSDGNTVTIYSIFKRNNLSKGDGNPLLYAVKKEKGFEFVAPYYEKLFWKRFSDILDKFISENEDIIIISSDTPTDCTSGILIPSTHNVNNKIAEYLSKKLPYNKIIDDALLKITNNDMLSACADENSYFYKYWSSKNEYEARYAELEIYLSKHLYDSFIIHNMPNELRISITNTLKVNPDMFHTYEPIINGANILIIDDTITHGQTFRSAYDAIIQCYKPKSITGLTMFSQKTYIK